VATEGEIDRLWQRGFHEHIIRHGRDWNRLRRYIVANPQNWNIDQENPIYW